MYQMLCPNVPHMKPVNLHRSPVGGTTVVTATPLSYEDTRLREVSGSPQGHTAQPGSLTPTGSLGLLFKDLNSGINQTWLQA